MRAASFVAPASAKQVKTRAKGEVVKYPSALFSRAARKRAPRFVVCSFAGYFDAVIQVLLFHGLSNAARPCANPL